MPKDNKPRGKRESAPAITDARFASFETDPRFQLPSKKNLKTKLDKRFSKVLKDADFTAVAKVDRYGRKLKTDTKKKALERLYEDESEDDTHNEDKPKKEKKDKKAEAEDESDFEVEDDDIVQRELEAANSYDPARGGGFSSSDDDSDSDEDDSEDEQPEVEDEADAETRPGIRLRKDKEAVEEGEITNRVAVVNIDWDHIKSIDLFALFNSFVPPGGRIEKVSIYPSEFGKQRMQREELEGPPQEIFKKKNDSDSDSDSDSEDSDSDEAIRRELLEEGDDQDFDSDALRTYQLDRLRYYYAVMVCSDKNTAHKIYEATDGSEYLSSSNFLDLRFIPDDVTFDDEPRDECDSVPPGYKPVEFVTDALQHSKVKLTWDTNPEDYSRKEALQKAFTGSRNDIAENDLRAYLASDSSDDEEESEAEEAAAAGAEEAAEEEKTLSKKELARRKMRAALGLADEPVVKSKKDAPVGEMQITFTPALSGNAKKGEEEREETTIEKYKRKERERKERKRQEMLARREGRDPNAPPQKMEEQGDFFEGAEGEGEDLGFDDPFFTAEPVAPSKTAIRKEERLKKKAEREAEEAANAAEKAQLELLMADENGDASGRLDHFDMKQIAKVEKVKGKKKGKKGKKGAESADGLQEEFAMDVEDSRFKAVFESHEFAIDPSNPKFKATQGMKKLLEEGRKKRKDGPSVTEKNVKSEKSNKKAKTDDADIDGLINSVKRKAKAGKQ